MRILTYAMRWRIRYTSTAVAVSRLELGFFGVLRVDTRSYMRPSLRDYGQCWAYLHLLSGGTSQRV